MKMRLSPVLSSIALLMRFAYGFSVSSKGGFGLLPAVISPRQASSSSNTKNLHFSPRGGGAAASAPEKGTELAASTPAYKAETKCPVTRSAAVFGSIWGTGGVLYVLSKAIRRVLPIALEPFQKGSVPLTQFQLGAYIVTCLWFAYVEGYKGFQQKFSPLVVTRSFTLIPGKNGVKWYHFIVAPSYSMGLIHATKKRKITSWSVTLGVVAIVAAVKQLPYPWRNIIDAGVVAGLSWGSLSILFFYVKSWITGQPPAVDAALPLAKKIE